MKKDLTRGLVFILLASLILFLAVAAFYSHRQAQAQLEAQLSKAGDLLARGWESGLEINDLAVSMYDSSSLPNLDLIVLKEDGEVILRLPDQANAFKEKSREEFRRAFAGEDRFFIRRFEQSHNSKLYYTLLVPSQAAAIRLGVEPAFPWQDFRPLLLSACFFTLLSLGFCYLWVSRKTRSYISSLEGLREALADLGQGNYAVQVSEIAGAPFNEVQALSVEFNRAGRLLEDRHEYGLQRMARLSTILNTIIDPLLLVDEDKNLLYSNSQALYVFGRNLDPEDKSYPQILLTHSEELDDLIDQSMSTGEDLDTILSLTTIKGDLRYKTLISPIFVEDSVYGVVVALHDLTVEEESAAFRRDFVANVTHELKTPLTSIRGFVETLRDNPKVSSEQAQRFYDIIDVEAERLEHLINDILSLSEAEQRKIKNIARFDLSELIDEVIVLLDDQASDKKVSVYTEDSLPECLPVEAEADRIKQVLINLVDNAIKYNKEGGKVSVTAFRLSPQKVQIVVKDNGPGISPEAQKRIFERFYRVDTGRSRSLGGTGLGLSIVKHIAQLYGGEARVESQPGHGSSFIVTMNI